MISARKLVTAGFAALAATLVSTSLVFLGVEQVRVFVYGAVLFGALTAFVAVLGLVLGKLTNDLNR